MADLQPEKTGVFPVKTRLIDEKLFILLGVVAEYFGFNVDYDKSISNFSILPNEEQIAFWDDLNGWPIGGIDLKGGKTPSGIAIGDKVQSVRDAYGKPMYEDNSDGKLSLVYGGLYGGGGGVQQVRLIFRFDAAGKLVLLEGASI